MNRNTVAALVIIGVLAFVLAMIMAENAEDDARTRVPVPSVTVSPCVTEDSTGCVWDCATMGNRTCGPVGFVAS